MPKRGENIYKRKDGRWEGRIKGMDFSVNGGKYKSIYGKTYKEVRKKMNEFRKELPHGKNQRGYFMKIKYIVQKQMEAFSNHENASIIYTFINL